MVAELSDTFCCKDGSSPYPSENIKLSRTTCFSDLTVRGNLEPHNWGASLCSDEERVLIAKTLLFQTFYIEVV